MPTINAESSPMAAAQGFGYEIATGIGIIVSAIGSGFMFWRKSPKKSIVIDCNKCDDVRAEVKPQLIILEGAQRRMGADIKEIKDENKDIHGRITQIDNKLSDLNGFLRGKGLDT